MLKKLLFILLVLSFVLLFGCQKKTKEVKLVPDKYKDWEMTASNLNYPIPGHENHYRQIFINKKGEKVKTEKKNGRLYYSYPDGTIIIKEIYATLNPPKDAKPISLAVMIKDPENPLSRDGWVWVVKTMKTGKEKIIDYEFCFDCHANANEPHQYGDGNPNNDFRDYVFFPYRR